MRIEIVSNQIYLKFMYEDVEVAALCPFRLDSDGMSRARQSALQLEQSLDEGRFRPEQLESFFEFDSLANVDAVSQKAGRPFWEFAEQWYSERRIEWRHSYAATIRLTLDKYLLPRFSDKKLVAIDKTAILAFRGQLADMPGLGGQGHLSGARINKIMLPLRMILRDAADRYDFADPWRSIKSVRIPRSDVDPLSLAQVERFLNAVRPDMRAYFEMRFFAGLRSSEINALRWSSVDLDRGTLHVKEAYVGGRNVPCKNDASNRIVKIPGRVIDQLKRINQFRPDCDLVFPARRRGAINNGWMTNHVWHPTCRAIGLARRRPYQTRHTAATLWLAAGENPEWIAKQLGHETCEMLFRIYARYVPDAVAKDGESFARLVQKSANVSKRSGRPTAPGKIS